MRWLVLLSFSVVMFLTPAPLHAQGKGADAPPDPKEQYAKKLAAFKTKCAEELYKLADALITKKQWATAKEPLDRAILHDPDFAKARQKLGFKKQGADWVRDASIKVPTTDDDKGDPDGRVVDKYKTDLIKSERKLADEAYKLGKWCADQKLAEESVAMYRTAIDWSDQHDDAHKALGHRKEGIKWITPDQDKERGAREEKAKAAEQGAEANEGSQEEGALGTKLNKRNSTHYKVQAYFQQDKIAKMIQAGEMMYREFHELFELDIKTPVVEQIQVLFLDNKKMHDSYLERIAGYAGQELEFQKKFGRDTMMQIPRIESHHGDDKAPNFPQDFMIHDTFHVLFTRHFGLAGNSLKGWLYECPAYWFSGRLNNSADCVCVGGESFAAGSSRGLGSDPHYWQGIVKDLVINHRAPEMRTTLICSMNSLTGEMIAKGWSVWDYMVREHKPKLFTFLKELSNGKEQEEALKEAFGWTYGELDHFWEEWVRKTY